MKRERERCDYCKKWVEEGELAGIYSPDCANFDLLLFEGEFATCEKCYHKHFEKGDRADIAERIKNMRTR